MNTRIRNLRTRISFGSWRAVRRVAADVWPLLQKTAAATLAWVIAKFVFDHPEPFFAPVAAVVALNTSVGERGLNAVRLLQGVVVGIVVGEVALAALSGGYGSLALATFAAMAIAQALGGTRIVVAQAAIGAILTVSVAEAGAGIDRLADAFIGAGVALLFSQVLFSPEPVRLLRRAEAAALADLADGLELTAAALESDDDELAKRAMSRLRAMHDRLVELGRMRQASRRVARRSAVWRSRKAPVVRENENAGHLDLLGVSCLMLTRTAVRTSPSERRTLSPSVRELAAALADMASEPGDRSIRQRAAERALDVVRGLPDGGGDSGSPFAAAAIAVRTVAADVMVFAGVESEQAEDAVREGTGQFEVPAPPSTPRMPLDLGRGGQPSRSRRELADGQPGHSRDHTEQ